MTPIPKRERRQVVDEDDTLALLNQMTSVLKFGDMWHARARGSDKFYKHADVRGAMRLALALDVLAEERRTIQQALQPTIPTRQSRRQRSLLDDIE